MKAKMNHTTSTAALLALFAVVQQGVEAAESAAPKEKSAAMRFMEQDYLLGTWGENRTWLSEHGVDFEFFYYGSVPSVVSGGRKTGSVYQGLFAMMMDLDSKKLLATKAVGFTSADCGFMAKNRFQTCILAT